MAIEGAVIMPHPPLLEPRVGKGEEQKIAATTAACREAASYLAGLQPQTVVVVSPHSTCYADYFHISPGTDASGSLARFAVPQTAVVKQYDSEFVGLLEQMCTDEAFPAGTQGERERALDHGTVIPLLFLEQYCQDYQLVRIGIAGLSGLAHYRLGQLLASVAEKLGRRTVILASGDLSHKLRADGPYGFAAEGPQFDQQITAAMEQADFYRFLDFDPDFCEAAAECGLRSFIVLAGALDRRKVTGQLLSYEGPFGVGYGVAVFKPGTADGERCFGERFARSYQQKLAKLQANEDSYVRLARRSLETYIQSGQKLNLNEQLRAELPEAMLEQQAGVFVSLHKQGQLRGCIGTTAAATDCIAAEIIRNAVSAGSEDPRFSVVTAAELPELVYSVDVLGTAENIASPEMLDVKKYGVIVSSRGRRGLLLPDLPGVATVEEQINIAKRKAGLAESESCQLQRFEVVRHH